MNKERITVAVLIVILVTLAWLGIGPVMTRGETIPPLPGPTRLPLTSARQESKASAAEMTTKGAGAAALLARPKSLVIPPKIRTNLLELAWTSPTLAPTNVVFTAWETLTQRRITNSIRYTNLFDVEGRRPAGAWVLLGTTNRPAFRHATTNSALWYRVRSYWSP